MSDAFHSSSTSSLADPPVLRMSNSFLRDSMLRLSIPTRDHNYYISDGNTVLLVENTLFKVHRSTLMKDSSTFDTLFSLPSEHETRDGSPGAESPVPSVSGPPEGQSDDNPIRLQGDSADQFRSLLWALYALPHELMIATSPEADPVLLYNLARISHKYQFKSILSWALSALVTYYTRPGAFDSLSSGTDSDSVADVSTSNASGPTLVHLTELAALCERTDLLHAAVKKWKRQITEGRDVSLAIGISERLNIRSILGLSYTAMLLKGRASWDTDPLLTRDQRVRLLSGHYSLARLWEKLPTNPPTLTHSAKCASPPRCTKAWALLWKEVLVMGSQIGNMEYVDVLGKLDVADRIMKALVERGEVGFLSGQGVVIDGTWLGTVVPHCKENALAATSAKLKEIKDGLADHFTDVF